jgi:hypothetical protein
MHRIIAHLEAKAKAVEDKGVMQRNPFYALDIQESWIEIHRCPAFGGRDANLA